MRQTVIVSICLIAAFSISALLSMRLSRRKGVFARMVDLPNERSLHAGAVPRSGGIAVLTGFAVACALALAAFYPPESWGWIVTAMIFVGGVSFVDDLGEVKATYRLAAHLGGGILLLLGGISWTSIDLPGTYWLIPSALSWLLTLGYLVWMINLFNFMDGMDGFAAGMAVFGFGTLALLGWLENDIGFALTSGILVAAAGGFLLHNFPPARIFLGDSGSATLGLLAATLSLIGAQRGLFPLWVAWLAFSPFLVDATWTLLRRIIRGERIWQAHRSHHYQRLVLAGWSHRRTVLWSYLLMAGCGATAVAARNMGEQDQWLLLGAWAIIYLLIGIKTRLTERLAGIAAP